MRTEEQRDALLAALNLLCRVGLGQVVEVFDHLPGYNLRGEEISAGERRGLLLRLETLQEGLMGSLVGASFASGNPLVRLPSRVARDIEAAVYYARARAGEELGVDELEPLHVAPEVPLVEVTCG